MMSFDEEGLVATHSRQSLMTVDENSALSPIAEETVRLNLDEKEERPEGEGKDDITLLPECFQEKEEEKEQQSSVVETASWDVDLLTKPSVMFNMDTLDEVPESLVDIVEKNITYLSSSDVGQEKFKLIIAPLAAFKEEQLAVYAAEDIKVRTGEKRLLGAFEGVHYCSVPKENNLTLQAGDNSYFDANRVRNWTGYVQPSVMPNVEAVRSRIKQAEN